MKRSELLEILDLCKAYYTKKISTINYSPMTERYFKGKIDLLESLIKLVKDGEFDGDILNIIGDTKYE